MEGGEGLKGVGNSGNKKDVEERLVEKEKERVMMVKPPRIEDAGLEDCALPPHAIQEAFFKAAAAVAAASTSSDSLFSSKVPFYSSSSSSDDDDDDDDDSSIYNNHYIPISIRIDIDASNLQDTPFDHQPTSTSSIEQLSPPLKSCIGSGILADAGKAGIRCSSSMTTTITPSNSNDNNSIGIATNSTNDSTIDQVRVLNLGEGGSVSPRDT